MARRECDSICSVLSPIRNTGPFRSWRFPYNRIEAAANCEIPPLIRGYLRVGAKICGEPAWDPDFNTADFLVWLPLDNIGARYARHFELLANNPVCTLPLAA